MKKFLLYLWQLPQNLLGFILMKICCNNYYVPVKIENYIVNYTTKFGGISLGKYIIINSKYSGNYKAQTIDHEIGHCKQSQYLGWLYLPVIGIFSGIHNLLHQWKVAKGNYYEYWCEKWADKLGKVKRK